MLPCCDPRLLWAEKITTEMTSAPIMQQQWMMERRRKRIEVSNAVACSRDPYFELRCRCRSLKFMRKVL